MLRKFPQKSRGFRAAFERPWRKFGHDCDQSGLNYSPHANPNLPLRALGIDLHNHRGPNLPAFRVRIEGSGWNDLRIEAPVDVAPDDVVIFRMVRFAVYDRLTAPVTDSLEFEDHTAVKVVHRQVAANQICCRTRLKRNNWAIMAARVNVIGGSNCAQAIFRSDIDQSELQPATPVVVEDRIQRREIGRFSCPSLKSRELIVGLQNPKRDLPDPDQDRVVFCHETTVAGR